MAQHHPIGNLSSSGIPEAMATHRPSSASLPPSHHTGYVSPGPATHYGLPRPSSALQRPTGDRHAPPSPGYAGVGGGNAYPAAAAAAYSPAPSFSSPSPAATGSRANAVSGGCAGDSAGPPGATYMHAGNYAPSSGGAAVASHPPASSVPYAHTRGMPQQAAFASSYPASAASNGGGASSSTAHFAQRGVGRAPVALGSSSSSPNFASEDMAQQCSPHLLHAGSHGSAQQQRPAGAVSPAPVSQMASAAAAQYAGRSSMQPPTPPFHSRSPAAPQHPGGAPQGGGSYGASAGSFFPGSPLAPRSPYAPDTPSAQPPGHANAAAFNVASAASSAYAQRASASSSDVGGHPSRFYAAPSASRPLGTPVPGQSGASALPSCGAGAPPAVASEQQMASTASAQCRRSSSPAYSSSLYQPASCPPQSFSLSQTPAPGAGFGGVSEIYASHSSRSLVSDGSQNRSPSGPGVSAAAEGGGAALPISQSASFSSMQRRASTSVSESAPLHRTGGAPMQGGDFSPQFPGALRPGAGSKVPTASPQSSYPQSFGHAGPQGPPASAFQGGQQGPRLQQDLRGVPMPGGSGRGCGGDLRAEELIGRQGTAHSPGLEASPAPGSSSFPGYVSPAGSSVRHQSSFASRAPTPPPNARAVSPLKAANADVHQAPSVSLSGASPEAPGVAAPGESAHSALLGSGGCGEAGAVRRGQTGSALAEAYSASSASVQGPRSTPPGGAPSPGAGESSLQAPREPPHPSSVGHLASAFSSKPGTSVPSKPATALPSGSKTLPVSLCARGGEGEVAGGGGGVATLSVAGATGGTGRQLLKTLNFSKTLFVTESFTDKKLNVASNTLRKNYENFVLIKSKNAIVIPGPKKTKDQPRGTIVAYNSGYIVAAATREQFVGMNLPSASAEAGGGSGGKKAGAVPASAQASATTQPGTEAGGTFSAAAAAQTSAPIYADWIRKKFRSHDAEPLCRNNGFTRPLTVVTRADIEPPHEVFLEELRDFLVLHFPHWLTAYDPEVAPCLIVCKANPNPQASSPAKPTASVRQNTSGASQTDAEGDGGAVNSLQAKPEELVRNASGGGTARADAASSARAPRSCSSGGILGTSSAPPFSCRSKRPFSVVSGASGDPTQFSLEMDNVSLAWGVDTSQLFFPHLPSHVHLWPPEEKIAQWRRRDGEARAENCSFLQCKFVIGARHVIAHGLKSQQDVYAAMMEFWPILRYFTAPSHLRFRSVGASARAADMPWGDNSGGLTPSKSETSGVHRRFGEDEAWPRAEVVSIAAETPPKSDILGESRKRARGGAGAPKAPLAAPARPAVSLPSCPVGRGGLAKERALEEFRSSPAAQGDPRAGRAEAPWPATAGSSDGFSSRTVEATLRREGAAEGAEWTAEGRPAAQAAL
ncbi:hypothetical protein BESB_060650 [Besnoitia besnoiti]|uniref:Uncharacterized protein n=1 Tax=Besnoitia besnoiti TaxID=94643 RepID=A0A2A9M9M3_BESBE|nr:hypothetical protein BESB_060650 [Besnoitia besnoiti]PFH35178.1 hypothetical protein BESB_060650 [Besnoitia besnoiti]